MTGDAPTILGGLSQFVVRVKYNHGMLGFSVPTWYVYGNTFQWFLRLSPEGVEFGDQEVDFFRALTDDEVEAAPGRMPLKWSVAWDEIQSVQVTTEAEFFRLGNANVGRYETGGTIFQGKHSRELKKVMLPSFHPFEDFYARLGGRVTREDWAPTAAGNSFHYDPADFTVLFLFLRDGSRRFVLQRYKNAHDYVMQVQTFLQARLEQSRQGGPAEPPSTVNKRKYF